MKFKSIAMRVFVLVIPTIIITTISFTGLSYYISSSQINHTINDRINESLLAADLEIQLELYKNASVATIFANYASMLDNGTFSYEDHEKFLSEGILSNANTFAGGIWFEPYALKSDLYYFGPYLYRDDGGTVYVPEYGSRVDYLSQEWYIKGKESNGEVIWSNVYYDPVSKKTMITATKPFYDKAGKFMGVGTADMSLDNIRNIAHKISIGETGKAFLLGANGEYISFYGNVRSVNGGIHNSDEMLTQLSDELFENESGVATLNMNGQKLRVYYMTMDYVNWKLAITFDEGEISSSTFNSFIIMTIIPILGLLLVIFGIFMIIRYLRKIVNKVNNFADMAASGDFLKRIKVTEIDEFGFMEEQLNKMISNMNDMSNHSAELLKLAENASNSKSEFLSRMSHEIRTPMNAIIGMTQIAKSSSDPAKITDCLLKIEGASKHLLALINDILDMSKIEANKLELSEDEFDIRQTLTNIYNMISIKAQEKHQNFTMNVDNNIQTRVISDELRFSQVITNLLGNAIKFTPENGDIFVDVRETESDLEYTYISISVKDSGIGLSNEQLGRLFQSFEQADSGISRKYGGTGLGLAISKRIVEMMNGKIWVTSELGEGSTFSFTVKMRKIEGDAKYIEASNKNNEPRAIRILVVDDSSEACNYMDHVLESLSLVCDMAHSGRDALRFLEKSMEINKPYDIVFIDHMMANTNSLVTANEAMKISANSVLVMMISMGSWNTIKQDVKNAGVKKHIAKPLSPDSVMACINEALSEIITGTNLAAKPPRADNFSENSILLAEDIEINREIVFALLEDTQIAIDYAENGILAVEKFRSNPHKYDMILMDIQMPEMDGFEATRQIRNSDYKRAKSIPIIAMTANALSEDVKKCMEAGMNDHIAKPIELEILLEKLNDYLFMKDFLEQDIC